MPVFNTAANQIQASPVRSYYQGKALRADIAAREKQTDLMDEEVAIDQQNADTAQANAITSRAKFERDVGLDAAKGFAQDLYSRIYAVDEAVTNGEVGEDEALQVAAKSFAEYAESLPEQYAAPILDKLQDGLTVEEYRQIKAGAAGALDEYGLLDSGQDDNKGQKAQFIGDDGIAHVGTYDPVSRQYTDAAGRVHANASPIAPQATQEDIGGLSSSGLNKVTIDYREKAQVAALTAATATEMVQVVSRSPAALAKSGAIVTFASEMYSTAKNLIQVANQAELPAEETALQSEGAEAFDWTTFDSSVKKLGLLPQDAVRLRAGLYSLAFSAAVGEQGSRPSDKDIQAYIKIYGGEITNANGFKAVIAQAMRRQRNGLYFMAEMNPEIVNPEVQMRAFDREYAKFIDALDTDTQTASGIKVGTVDSGYRYIGGDPANPSSWERVND